MDPSPSLHSAFKSATALFELPWPWPIFGGAGYPPYKAKSPPGFPDGDLQKLGDVMSGQLT